MGKERKKVYRVALAVGFLNDIRLRTDKKFRTEEEQIAYRQEVEVNKEEILIKEAIRLNYVEFNLLGHLVAKDNNSISYGLITTDKNKLHIVEIDRKGNNITLSNNNYNSKFNDKDHSLKSINKNNYNILEETRPKKKKRTRNTVDNNTINSNKIDNVNKSDVSKNVNGTRFIDFSTYATDKICKRKLKRGTIGETTILTYRNNNTYITNYFDKSVTIENLEPQHIDDFFTTILDKNYSTATLKKIKRTMKWVLEEAIKENYISEDMNLVDRLH